MPLMLPLQLVPKTAEPLHRQIETQLRVAILEGRLASGTLLPGIRPLADQLGVARITVQTAYEQLAAEGYLVAVVGSGTRVAPHLPDQMLRARVERRSAAAITSRAGLPTPNVGIPSSTYLSERPAPGALPYDFRPARPGIDLFPVELWGRLLRQAWRDLASKVRRSSLDYIDPAGLPALREALVSYVSASRAVRTSAGQVVVTTGAQASFDAVARLWFGQGRRCAVEDPGYPMAWRPFTASGTRLVPVRVDDDGLVTSELPKAADGAIVTPSWQYPAGGTLPLARRLELLQWAEDRSALIVEDDYDSELRYEGRPLAALQGIDGSGRVLYVGTFSKVAFPGLRLGYAIVPPAIRDRFVVSLELSQRGVSAVEQLALARFIEQGHFERHLRRIRTLYAERQACLLESLRERCVDWLDVSAAPAGMHLVAHLRDPRLRASDAVATAARHGVGMTAMLSKRLTPAPDRELLIGYMGLEPEEIRVGIALLAGSLHELTMRSVPSASSGHRGPAMSEQGQPAHRAGDVSPPSSLSPRRAPRQLRESDAPRA